METELGALLAVQGGPGCPEGHILALTEGSLVWWWCDLCGEERERTEAAWRCSEDWRQGRGGSCDFDVCTDCVYRHQEEEEEAALCALTGAASSLQVQEQEDFT